ncbi:MAG: class I SAM-dependent methyltransferase [Oscillospiraceae bacterium]
MLEKMDDFFAARVDDYEAHMLTGVNGVKEAYAALPAFLPAGTQSLLDLGCGTGLELEPIFACFPALQVTGVDLTKEMLDRLRVKFPDKAITLINASYFDCDFAGAPFDAAISFETMHHFDYAEKQGLYAKILDALKPGGVYVECDYMVTEQAEEDFYFAENKRIRAEMGIPYGAFYHYDTPLTVKNSRMLLCEAGFERAELLWRTANTTIIKAYKAQ